MQYLKAFACNFILLCIATLSLFNSTVHAEGEKLILANIPAGVSTDLFGKILASRTFAASDFTIGVSSGATATFTNSAFPLVLKKSVVDTTMGYTVLKFAAGKGNLAQFNGVDFVVENTTANAVTVNLIPYSQSSPEKPAVWSTFVLPANSGPMHLLLTLDSTTITKCAAQNGMQRCPMGLKQIQALFQSMLIDMDKSNMTQFRLNVLNMPKDTELKIHEIKGINISYKPSDIPGIIDAYGQNAWVDFVGKIKSDQDLRNDASAESKTLNPPPAGTDIYGGNTAASGYQATGYFRTQKIDNKWWFVTPLGNLMYMRGMNWVIHGASSTTIKNRAAIFKELPQKAGITAGVFSRDEPCIPTNNNINGVGEYCGGVHWLPYLTNIIKKYHDPAKPFKLDDVLNRWGINTQNRLQEWGVNALEGTSRVPDRMRMPYTLNVLSLGNSIRVEGTNLPDLFEPHYTQIIEANVQNFFNSKRIPGTQTPITSDPYLVGVFSDNELDFGHTFNTDPAGIYYFVLKVLTLNADTYTKREFVNTLKAKYPNVAALKTAWAQPFPGINSWDTFLSEPIVPIAPFNPALVSDLSTLLTHYIEKYYATARAAIKKAAPNHLYIGTRFAGFHRHPREATDMCVKYCDVYSVNYYNADLLEKDWNYLLTKDIPILLTEFQFGAIANGAFSAGPIAFPTQKDRAVAFSRFIDQLLGTRQIVGYFYHEYLDLPLSGVNFEAENWYASFVTIGDRTYPEMVTAAKAIAQRTYTLRGGHPNNEVLKPAIPGGLEVHGVTFSWKAPLNSPVPVTGYELRVSKLQNDYSASVPFLVNSPTVLQTKATDLPPGRYYARVHALGAGSLKSAASNEVVFDVPTPVIAPAISKQPTNLSVSVGQSATFNVVATGSTPLTYQWKKNNIAIAGATGATYTTPLTVIGDNNAKFTVIVSNSVNAVTSAVATLTVATPATYTVSIAKAGTGTGRVGGAGVNCGTTCSMEFSKGAVVSFYAVADDGSVFTGWSGACSGGALCKVTMDGAKSVTANFSSMQPTLSVSMTGTATGRVGGAGINCGSGTICSAQYAKGTKASLYAVAAPGAVFAGWSGACSGGALCEVTLDAAKNVVARFEIPRPRFLSVSKSGTGTGTVAGIVKGGGNAINCGAVCTSNAALNAVGTLVATPQAGSEFTGWGGACTGRGACIVTLSSAKTVTATFTAIAPTKYPLSVAKTGAGTVSAGLSTGASLFECGNSCSAQVDRGAAVTLRAVPAANFTFASWSGGGCSGTVATCTTTVNSAAVVTAKFIPADKFYLALEAEQAAVVDPITPLNERLASGGKGVVSPVWSRGSITFTFEVFTAGTYYVWARMMAPDGNSNSYFVALDNGADDIFDMFGVLGFGTEWQWDLVNGRNSILKAGGKVVPRSFTLQPGTHKLIFKGREVNAALDAILITNDLNFVPGEAATTDATLNVVTSGVGKGQVVAQGINCPGDCAEKVKPGAVVTLDAKPATGQKFTQWSGICKGTTPSCTAIIMSNATAIAGFAPR